MDKAVYCLYPICTNCYILSSCGECAVIDPASSASLLRDEINKTGTTILMVTHEHELVNRFHHRTVTLEKGRIIRDQGGASHV